MTDENLAAEVAALVRELNSYEARVAAGDESYADRVELVCEQLRLRGAGPKAPSKRAETRERKDIK